MPRRPTTGRGGPKGVLGTKRFNEYRDKKIDRDLRETYNTSHVGAMDTRGLDDEAEEVSLSGTAIEERKRQAKQSERMQQEHDDDDFLIMDYSKG